MGSLALPGTEIWAVCPVGDSAAAARGGDRSLFDNAAGGGSGGSFDWSLLKGRDDLAGGVLAGGINPGNARKAATVGAYAIDVGSGVEAAPGVKDPAKVEALFAALRPAARGEA